LTSNWTLAWISPVGEEKNIYYGSHARIIDTDAKSIDANMDFRNNGGM